jgi:brefeldin A-inhibited guanine nucleotide-exchange protein
MTKDQFLKNNRGIDQGNDLDQNFLESIYDVILNDEIIMKDEHKEEPVVEAQRDPVRNYALASESMAQKTEAILHTITKTPEDFSVEEESADAPNETFFYSANHYIHVKAMFEIIWLSILAGLSLIGQESDDVEMNEIAMDGFKSCISISGFFQLDLQIQAFVSTLIKYTQLNAVDDEVAKNMTAVKALLAIANTDGNYLNENWKDVIRCVSKLEKLKLIGDSPDEIDHKKEKIDSQKRSKTRRRSISQKAHLEEVAAEIGSQLITVQVDRIFTNSKNLSGKAIVYFVRHLCDVSWEEIESSSNNEHPRMYCLQRLVEISFYNMGRIRVEWVNIWAILGEHLNRVGCHKNTNVGYFALDKLRQLAINFLDLEELPTFKFQKEFLKPFESAITKTPDLKMKDMVLACIQQLIQAKGKKLKSGWKVVFAILIKTAKEHYGTFFTLFTFQEPIVILAFDITKMIFKSNFEVVATNGSFPDLLACLVEFCKNIKFLKIR